MKHVTTISKFMVLIMMICMVPVSVFSAGLVYDQDSNIADLETGETGNVIREELQGNINKLISTGVNQSTPYDIQYELDAMKNPVYVTINNGFKNSTYTLLWQDQTSNGTILNKQNFTMNEKGRYVFKFVPDAIGETTSLYVDIVDDKGIAWVTYQEQQPEGFNQVIGGLVGSFEDIIEINISIWYIVFYLLIFVALLTVVAGMFGFGFLILQHARKMREKDHGLYNAGGDK